MRRTPMRQRAPLHLEGVSPLPPPQILESVTSSRLRRRNRARKIEKSRARSKRIDAIPR